MRHHWFIGDIHGCLDSLQRLEERLRRASELVGGVPHFVSVGDLVDRGPDSAGVVQWFRRGSEAGTHSAILGNHEEMMLRCLHDAIPEAFEGFGLSRWVVTGDLYREASPRRAWLNDIEANTLSRLMWLAQGGTPTLRSWGVDPHDLDTWELPTEDLAWLSGLPLIFECEHAIASHALLSAEDLACLREPGEMTSELRDAVFRTLWRRTLPLDGPDSRMHVSGHTPLRRVRRYADRRVLRVDTGCYLGRRLSAWCPEIDRVVSVEGEFALPS